MAGLTLRRLVPRMSTAVPKSRPEGVHFNSPSLCSISQKKAKSTLQRISFQCHFYFMCMDVLTVYICVQYLQEQRSTSSLGTVFTGHDYLPSSFWELNQSSFSSQCSSLSCYLSICAFIEKLFDLLIKVYFVMPCPLSMPSLLLPFQVSHFKYVFKSMCKYKNKTCSVYFSWLCVYDPRMNTQMKTCIG